MESKVLNHIQANLETLQSWFDNNSRPQVSSDILKPIIPEFQKEFPTVNIHGCPDCVHDMIGWALIEYKKTVKTETKPKTK